MNPLTRNEVESWPALGPMNLDKQRVLDLIDRAADAGGLEVQIAELRAANAQLTAERDDARRQRDECAAQLRFVNTPIDTLLAEPATNDDARAILHALASQPARPPVAVVDDSERHLGYLVLRVDGQRMEVTTDEAAALVTALLADGAVHNAWLHGRGGK